MVTVRVTEAKGLPRHVMAAVDNDGKLVATADVRDGRAKLELLERLRDLPVNVLRAAGDEVREPRQNGSRHGRRSEAPAP